MLRSFSFAVEFENPQYRKILLRLADEGVEVIVVGMAAAILQGVPTTTWDLDVEDLLASSVVIDFEGRSIRVLTLKELIAVKRRAARPKDLAAIPYIESTLDEIERQSGQT